MKKYQAIDVFFMTYLLFSVSLECGCQDSRERVKKTAWVAPLSQRGLIGGNFPLVLDGDAILCHGIIENGSSVIYKKDLNDGQTLWEWSDNNDELSLEHSHLHNQILVVKNGNTYGIDTQTGKSLWKNKYLVSRDRGVSGIGNYYFYNGHETTVFIGNTRDGKEKTLVSIQQKSGNKILPSTPVPYVNNKRDTLAILPFLYFDGSKIEAHYIYYNLTKQREEYNQVIHPLTRESGGIWGEGVYRNYTYFAIGFYFFCHRLSDGKQMWMKDMPRNIGTILVADDTFFGVCQNDSLYAYHAVTGKPLWQTLARGTTEQLFYMNGVLYYVGGNGLLYAIEGKTGKVLWKRMSPDVELNSGSGFKGNVVGANGKIYVSSYLNLYCFNAAQ